MHIKDGIHVMIRRLDSNIARMYFVDDEEAEFPTIPIGFVLRHTDTSAEAAQFENSFLICWMSSYMLMYQDKIVMFLDNQRQQSYLCMDV